MAEQPQEPTVEQIRLREFAIIRDILRMEIVGTLRAGGTAEQLDYPTIYVYFLLPTHDGPDNVQGSGDEAYFDGSLPAFADQTGAQYEPQLLPLGAYLSNKRIGEIGGSIIKAAELDRAIRRQLDITPGTARELEELIDRICAWAEDHE